MAVCKFCKYPGKTLHTIIPRATRKACGNCIAWMKADIGEEVMAELEDASCIRMRKRVCKFYLKSPLELLAETGELE